MMRLALLTLCSCFKKCWLIEPLCYSILFSDDVANDEESELQGALISTIFCKVDLRKIFVLCIIDTIALCKAFVNRERAQIRS